MADEIPENTQRPKFMRVTQRGDEIEMIVVFDLRSLHVIRQMLDQYETILLALEPKP